MFGGKLGLPELLIVVAVCVSLAYPVAIVMSWAKIFSKAGFSPVLCIAMLIPLVNLGFLLWFAFSDWPIETQVRSAPQYAPPHPELR